MSSSGYDRSGSKCYYAVSLPLNFNNNGDELVFENCRDAVDVVKKYSGSRFKCFNKFDEAVKFSKESLTNRPDVKVIAKNEAEKQTAGPYKGPTPKECVALRVAVDKGKFHDVKKLIWSNPRYLISSGDTPVIVMEGPRYNCAHVASKSNQSNVLRLILETISNANFIKLLYPADSERTIKSRISFILDLYLNTPDKGACETPIHFACKFGSVEAVEVLMSYSGCDVNKLNKQNQRPFDVICARKEDEKSRRMITKLFENRFYVPIIRDDETASPIIGKPCDYIPANRDIKGLAGPMSPEVAASVYDALKSPSRRNGDIINIRLTDSQKGIERVARSVCKELNVNWVEFWPFLDQHVELSSEKGLNLLNNHLMKVYEKRIDNEFCSLDSIEFENNSNWEKSTISQLCDEFNKLDFESTKNTFSDRITESRNSSLNEQIEIFNESHNLDSDDDSDEFHTASSSFSFHFEFYVDGSKPTHWDIKALTAICDQEIDDLKYPFIANWVKCLQTSDFKNLHLPLIMSPASPSIMQSNGNSVKKSDRFVTSTPRTSGVHSLNQRRIFSR